MTQKLLAAASAALIAAAAPVECRLPISLADSLAILAAAGVTPRDFGLTKPQYTVNESLTLLGIGRNSLYAMVSSGELVAVKFGRKTMFAAPDLARVILTRRGADSLPMQRGPAKRGRPAKSAPLECEGA
jgi:hypothetical protein